MKTLSYSSLMDKEFEITKTTTLEDECQHVVIILLLKDDTVVEYMAYDNEITKHKSEKAFWKYVGDFGTDIKGLEQLDKNLNVAIHTMFLKKGNSNIKLIRYMEL